MLERALLYLISTGLAMATASFVSDQVIDPAFCLRPDAAGPSARCGPQDSEGGLHGLLQHLETSAR